MMNAAAAARSAWLAVWLYFHETILNGIFIFFLAPACRHTVARPAQRC